MRRWPLCLLFAVAAATSIHPAARAEDAPAAPPAAPVPADPSAPPPAPADPAPPAQVATQPEAPAPLPDDATPEQILDGFVARWKNWRDYACTLDTTVRKGKLEDRSVLHYTFKRPNLFKSNVLQGKDEGAWVWREPEGRIRAKTSGALSLIKITMKEDDKRLADVRGARLQDADWGYMVRAFIKRREQGWTFTRAADETIADEPCFVVVAEGKADALGVTREAFAFSRRDSSVRARRLWEGEFQVDDTVYKDVKIDQGLSDGDFRL